MMWEMSSCAPGGPPLHRRPLGLAGAALSPGRVVLTLLIQLGLAMALASGQSWAGSGGEPCITCRTDDCPTKPNIEAWCGEGDDPLGRGASPSPSPSAAQAANLPVEIDSEPHGALVSVGTQELGKTPLRRVKLRRGEQRLRFALPGYATVEWPVRVQRQGQQFLVTLQPEELSKPAEPARESPTARIDIESQPQGATVRLDGQSGAEAPLGMTPLRGVEVPKGQHQLTLTLRGYEPSVLDLLVQRDSERYLLTLRRPFCKKCLIGGLVAGAVVLGAVGLTVGLVLRPPTPPDDIRDPSWRALPSP